jgi:hypothetical protein
LFKTFFRSGMCPFPYLIHACDPDGTPGQQRAANESQSGACAIFTFCGHRLAASFLFGITKRGTIRPVLGRGRTRR